MGPLELLDLIGLDTQVRLCEAFYPVTLDPRAAARRCCGAWWRPAGSAARAGRGFFTYDGNAMFGA